MASSRQQAAADHNLKLVLERRLRTDIDKLNVRTVREYTRAVSSFGVPPNFFKYEDDLQKILTRHDNLVATVFTDRINKMVLAEEEEKALVPVRMNAVEAGTSAIHMLETFAFGKTIVPVVVSRYLATKTSIQVGKISETTRKEAGVALTKAKKLAATSGVEKIEIASTSGSLFRTSLSGRTTGIVRLNTNVAAESAKMTQIQVLSGEEPSLGGGTGESNSKKTWANMGDSLVRSGASGGFKYNHLSAEQTVSVDKPFKVNGESLRFPGDQSLGAHIANVINCRCSATYDIRKVVKARKKLKESGALVPNIPDPSTAARVVKPQLDSLFKPRLTRRALKKAKKKKRQGFRPPPRFRPPKRTTRTFANERLMTVEQAGEDGTMAMYRRADGSWTPKRAQMHEEIIEEFMKSGKTVAEGEELVLQLLGGGPASGKSSLGLVAPKNSVIIDVDKIKAFLPEFQVGAKKGNLLGAVNNTNAAAIAHQESSYLGKEIAKRASKLRMNTVLDQVGDGEINKFIGKLKPFTNAKYKIKGNYVTVDVKEAVRRAKQRALRTGRTVPEEVIRVLHAGVSDTTMKALHRGVFDEFRLVLGTKDATSIAQIVDGKLVVKNKKLWGEFVDKASAEIVN